VRAKPLSIVVYDHQLYVVCRDDKGKDHPYRFSRITQVDREDTTFAYPTKAEYDPDRLFADSFGIFIGAEYPVESIELKMAPRWSVFVEHHRWHRTQEIVRRSDHVLVRMRARACPELQAWILGLGADVEVLAPNSLRKVIASKVRAMGKVYGATKSRISDRPIANSRERLRR